MKSWSFRSWTFLSLCAVLLVVGFLAHLDLGETVDLRKGHAAPAKPKIPDQAIRLRILAHSDSVQDQWLKRKVRDEIIKEIGTWAEKPQSIDEARALVKRHLPRLADVAERTVKRHGYDYPVKVDFGMVPFPTKLYGETVYPAGNYEALRVTIGDGKGDNWWCVLFPPLCFVNMENGDAVKKPSRTEAALSSSLGGAAKAFASEHEEMETEKPAEGVAVRFYVVEKVEKWLHQKKAKKSSSSKRHKTE